MSKKDEEEVFDFGFTAVYESEISNSDEIETLKSKLNSVRKMFEPLLLNLMKNPEKEMIKWPNRKEILEKQLEKLKALTTTD
jgi:hypothetical protein